MSRATDGWAPAIVADRILAGEPGALPSAGLHAYLAGEVDVWELIAAAGRIRAARFGNRVHLCSIVNAKEGGCPEDCGFCAQSKHYDTHVKPAKFTPIEEIVRHSRVAGTRHASALGLVTATRGLDDDGFGLDHMARGIAAVRDAGHTEAHASVGFLTEPAMDRLIAAGLTELNHNLETGRDYFGKIVTTHSYDERIATVRMAKAKGLRTCCGGIFGMGEQIADRVDLAVNLRELDVDEVPINFLVGIEGTPLAQAEPLAPMEMLRIIAAYRMFLPRQNIFIAAGRTHLGQLLPMMFAAGASGMMVGDFLTTANRSVDDDLRMIDELGLVPMSCGTERPELAARPVDTVAARTAAKRLPVVA
ncbi:MAG: biotin synthase BioB [Deltaproteobacteria bacterium]|nr:biotin synthase BioB [Nannocystaceae bacterium]